MNHAAEVTLKNSLKISPHLSIKRPFIYLFYYLFLVCSFGPHLFLLYAKQTPETFWKI